MLMNKGLVESDCKPREILFLAQEFRVEKLKDVNSTVVPGGDLT